ERLLFLRDACLDRGAAREEVGEGNGARQQRQLKNATLHKRKLLTRVSSVNRRALLHALRVGNFAFSWKIVTAIAFPICASRSPIVATNAAPTACRRNCRNGSRAKVF